MNQVSIPVPSSAPKIGVTYQHYKGDLYQVIEMALHSNDGEWMVVYKPLYENAVADLFTRPLSEWDQEVEWPVGSGIKTLRFKRI